MTKPLLVTIERPEGFDLAAAADFYRGFVPGSGMAASNEDGDARRAALTLSFLADDSYAPIAVRLVQKARTIEASVFGAGAVDAGVVRRQIGRMLGLEADASAWAELRRRDPIVRALTAEYPGFFTAAKASPWDAATWSILSQRITMKQAAKVKVAMARTLGDAIEVDGETRHVFPSPRVVAGLERVEGVSDEKVARLRGLAEAALRGDLDAERLRALGEERALASLEELRGIGPWSAAHVYFRGAAPPDGLPAWEPRARQSLALLLGKVDVSADELRAAAEAWRPFRMWVTVLLVRHLGRTGRWNAHQSHKAHTRPSKVLRGRGRELSTPRQP